MKTIKPTNSPESELVDRVTAAQLRKASQPGTRLSRAWNVLRYYRKSQLALRAISLVGKRFGLDAKSRSAKSLSVATEPEQFQTRAQSAFETIRQIRVATSYRSASDIRQQLGIDEISVLNLQLPLRWRINEGTSPAETGVSPNDKKSLLWQFQLHYHEFLLPLAGVPTTAGDVDMIARTIESWIEENPISNPAVHLDAWHPYCISRRLPVWFCLLTLPELNDSTRDRMLSSARLQAEFLSSNLEWDLRGNHLLENLRALAMAGCFFESDQSNRWLEQVRRILPTQIKEQILLHGEHFERCPMYHCQIFGNFLETLIVARNVDQTLCELVRPVAEKMFVFLAEIVHSDGEIPLLGDSCFGESPNVHCLEWLAEVASLDCPEPQSPSAGEITTIGDYWIFRDQNDYLIFDRGPAGADTLPAHAHADLLTMESSIGGTRWLVDSGLFGYDDDPMRAYCRSSPAHNIVCVADQNQLDIWSKFRMGSRSWPSDLAQGHENGLHWATASHDAYRSLGITKLSRLIGIHKHRFWFCLDRQQSANKTSRALTGFMHFAPDVAVSKLENGEYRLAFAAHVCILSFIGAVKTDLIESWYCPEFGRRIKNLTLEYTMDPQATLTGWLLIPQKAARPVDLQYRPWLAAQRLEDSDQITVFTHADGVIQTFNWKFNP